MYNYKGVCMINLFLVALGGAVGAVCRYCLGNIISKALGSGFPYGTFIINIVGCLCMGFFMTMIVERQLLPPIWRLFLCVGLLGGFTTFSSFGYEFLQLLIKGEIVNGFIYAGSSLFLGLMAAALGCYVAKL